MMKPLLFVMRSKTVRTVAATSVVFFAFFLSTALFSAVAADRDSVSAATVAEEKITVVLDAGHGGEDAGAIGENGVYEKDLNLAYARTLAAILRSAGVNVVETRTEDRLLYTDEQNIKGYRKVYDLRNRLEISESYENAVFVSIHMNNFTDARYSGLQIYYSKNRSDSYGLAQALQDGVRASVDPENDRAVKAAGDNIYLLDRAENTAILIECGFLSNSEECEKLCSEDYRKQLCFVLACGMINYIEEIENLCEEEG